MKDTLARLISPDRGYKSLGELAITLRWLLETARDFRDPGQWGDSGPTEILTGRSGCTGSYDARWSTGRMSVYHSRGGAEREAHVRDICDCIISGLCSDSPASLRWRSEHDIELHMPIQIRSREHHCGRGEDEAMKAFFALQGQKIKASLNSSHPRAKTLWGPEIYIGSRGISCDVQVCYASDKGSSSWSVAGFLMRDAANRPNHIWKPNKHTFAEWLALSTAQFAAL